MLSLHRLLARRRYRLGLYRLLDFRLRRALGTTELPLRNTGRLLSRRLLGAGLRCGRGAAFRRAELPLLSGDGRLLSGGRLRLEALRLYRRLGFTRWDMDVMYGPLGGH